MKKVEIEKLFLLLGFFFGCLFIFLIPPFQSPDEDSHFKKAYTISEGRFYALSNGKISGLKIPDVMHLYIEDKLSVREDLDYKYTYKDFYSDQFFPSDFSHKTLREVSTSKVAPIAHLIPATGILFAKLVSPIFVDGTPSTAFMLYFARFFSLISYLTIGYFALKVTPVFKKSMMAILLLPMSLFLGSMVTYDNLLIPVSLLAIAYILKLIYDKKELFQKKHFILFCVIGYILLNVKVVYSLLLLLLLFVPKDKFIGKSDKDKFQTYFKIAGIVFLFTVLLKLPNYFLDVEPTKTLASDQLRFILTHPFDYTKILIFNFLGQLRIQLCWMIGTFGLLDTQMPPLFLMLSFLNLLFVFVMDAISEKVQISYKLKMTVLLILILSVVGMYTIMYIDWTPKIFGVVGGDQITGVQGRYFLPLLICCPILFSNRIFDRNKRIQEFTKTYFLKSVFVLSTCLAVSILVNLVRFWV
ncbi:MAG: DUF2142 domain-containing protein [Bacilli bacterium]|nr:DUF2142 domain-containing protein [Bacilli bacterium]